MSIDVAACPTQAKTSVVSSRHKKGNGQYEVDPQIFGQPLSSLLQQEAEPVPNIAMLGAAM